jgi:hypothetical protein
MNPFNPRSGRTLRGQLARAAGAGAAAVVVAGTLGAGVAIAAPNAGAPQFNSTQASSLIRGSGSDTTFFMMQKIGDLYTTAGLFGCQLVTSAGQNLFGGGSSTAANVNQACQAGSADISTTDDADNWNRVEVVQGVNSVGSGAGQNQLCGSVNKPVGLNVDFARSSKPSAGISSCNEQELGYAKDGVPIVDFPTINPSTFGTSTFASGQVASNAFPNAAYSSINSGVVGPVANGWLPGDNPAGTANKGTKVGSISNVGALDQSVAFRLWCQPHSSGSAITDWGQMTNLGPNLEVNVDTTSGSPTVNIDASSGTAFSSTIASGNAVTDPFSAPAGTPFAAGTTTTGGGGAGTLTLSSNATTTGTFTLTFATGAAKLAQGSGVSVGIPIRIVGVNTGSGTTFTFAQFADGQTRDPSNACTSSATLSNQNAANDPASATAPSGNPFHIALENNSHQLELFSQADFPSDNVDQAIEEATSLYFMSNGVYNTNAFVGQTTIGGTNFAGNLVGENGTFSGAATELNNSYPTARTLSNITNAVTVRQSTGGFLNWICDSNANFSKGTDLNTGSNFDAELSNIISTNFGFPRLSDVSSPVAATPADNVVAPNDDCVAHIPVTTDGTTANVTYAGIGSAFPASIVAGGSVTGTGVPAGATVTTGGGSATVTLSTTLAAGNYTLSFVGVPGVATTSSTP